MKRLASLALGFVFLLGNHSCPAAPLTQEALIQGLQKDPSIFQKVEIKDVSTPVELNLTLKEETLQIGGERFDGFRFTAPADSDAMDWVWYFNTPAKWGEWYITPAQGKNSEAFRTFLKANQLYQEVDQVGEEGRVRMLQPLAAGYFKPGQEYIMWFHRITDGTADTLRARIRFAKKESEWNFETMEKVLELKPMDLSAQIEHLKSRGGKILLDPALFEKAYGEKQIDSFFSNLRRTSTLSGNLFVTMENSVPNGQTSTTITQTSYKDIREKYGEADFIITSAEKKRAWLNQGYKDTKKEAAGQESTVTYFYDFFGFEVSTTDPGEKIRSVVTHGTSYAKLRGDGNGDTFGRIPNENLTVFYHDKKEVGRFYNFLEDNIYPLPIQEPPPGIYKGDGETLEYQGDGKWLWLTLHPDGSPSRRVSLEHHVMEGKAEGRSPQGKVQFSASYKNGKLNGNVIQYNDDGQIAKKQTFLDGKLQSTFQ